jgi:hypothetical protein
MTHEQDQPGHVAAVDAWLAHSLAHDSSVEIVSLFEVAYEALWNRAVSTLGSVTLAALTDRALFTAAGRYAFLSAMAPCSHGDLRSKPQTHERLASVPRSELIEGLRFGLLELITVIGRLTAEILSEELHAALMETTATTPDPEAPE